MPRSDGHHPTRALSGRGYNHLSAEEAAGIAILVMVIAVLLIIGCWYCKRRRGYKIIKNHFGPAVVRTLRGSYCEQVAPMDIKLPLQEYSNLDLGPVVPDAPPADSKTDTGSLPPPYSP
ncbi:melanoma antigen recognized by T-cells 1 isoform X2 [Microcaecilia unicolor]|uniref:Melanoma antigen recognized by T-cells 1 isoform X2 n=1 Tax=Microcaecilia unicolor TaxID=1415580 RepID=A0A6P7X4I8_9AMPH|nr:melanoma antigen recognized by T-cells 1 isoform X2 [Microcaecilia unicolor]